MKMYFEDSFVPAAASLIRVSFYLLSIPDKHSSLGESYRESRDIRDGDRDRNDRDRREMYHSEDMYDRRDSRKYGQGKVELRSSVL